MKIIPIKLCGERAEGADIAAGAMGSYNDAILRLRFDSEWDEYNSRTVTFRDALGENPIVKLLTPTTENAGTESADTYFDAHVPITATRHQGKMMVTVSGKKAELYGIEARISNQTTLQSATSGWTNRTSKAFYYNGTNWLYDGVEVTLNSYGIAYTGIPVAGDTITIKKNSMYDFTVFASQRFVSSAGKISAVFFLRVLPSAAAEADDGSVGLTLAEQVELEARRLAGISERYAKGTENGVEADVGTIGFGDNAKHYKGVAERYAKGTEDGASATIGTTGYQDNAKYYKGIAERYAKGTEGGVSATTGTTGYHDNAKYYKEQAASERKQAERYAKGTDGGFAVVSGTTGYHDNAKYYAEQAAAGKDGAESARDTAERYAKGTEGGSDVESGTGYHDNAKYYAEQAASLLSHASLMEAFGAATSSAAGYMSAADKAHLDTLFALLGSEADADTVVNTISEVLAIFENYPEGATVVQALSGKLDATHDESGTAHADIRTALAGKRDKITDAQKVYVVLSDGSQGQKTYTSEAMPNTIPNREPTLGTVSMDEPVYNQNVTTKQYVDAKTVWYLEWSGNDYPTVAQLAAIETEERLFVGKMALVRTPAKNGYTLAVCQSVSSRQADTPYRTSTDTPPKVFYKYLYKGTWKKIFERSDDDRTVAYVANGAGDPKGVPYTSANTPSTIVYRSSTGSFYVPDPTSAQHPATKNYADANFVKKLGAGNASRLYAVSAAGADTYKKYDSEATANTVVARNANGDFNVNTPTGNAHPTTKKYVDDALAGKEAAGTAAAAVAAHDESGAAHADIRAALDGKVPKQTRPASGFRVYMANAQYDVVPFGYAQTTLSNEKTAGTLVYRRGNSSSTGAAGTFDAAYPQNDDNVATKQYVDDAVAGGGFVQAPTPKIAVTPGAVYDIVYRWRDSSGYYGSSVSRTVFVDEDLYNGQILDFSDKAFSSKSEAVDKGSGFGDDVIFIPTEDDGGDAGNGKRYLLVCYSNSIGVSTPDTYGTLYYRKHSVL